MSQEFVIRPNRSLSARGRKLLLIGVATLMSLVTLRIYLLGGWMVIPFMVAEFMVLVIAFCLVSRHCNIVERVVIRDDELTIHHEEARHPRHWTFPLHWVNVDLKPGRYPTHGTRLLIGSHGKWVELAGFLTNRERESLTRAIREAIDSARQSTCPEGLAGGV